MAIQMQGNGGVVAEVDGTTFRAMRVTARPINYGSLGFYRLGMYSGTIAASLAANAEVFQFRWPDASNLALVYRVTVSAGANVAATAAALGTLVMVAARSWTAAGSGGTRAVLTGNISKLRTSMGTSLVNDAGISSTVGLTAGTKTIDHATTNMGSVAFGIGTGAITTALNLSFIPNTDLFNSELEGNHPLVLATNEGFIIRNGTVAFPGGMTWVLAVNVAWAEAAAF
jgi:hypothetical protein